MAPNAVNNESPWQSATRSDPRKTSGVLEDVQSLWQELRELSHDRFQLAALETQRAGYSLVSRGCKNFCVNGHLVENCQHI
jgi:hypothetical protein